MSLDYDLDKEIVNLRKKFHFKLAAKRGLDIGQETDIRLLENSDKKIQESLLRLHRRKRIHRLLNDLFSFKFFRKKK